MPQLTPLPRETISSTLTVSVAAGADATQRAVSRLELTDEVDVRVTADHEESSWLTIVTRAGVARSVIRALAKRVKHRAEEDRFETIGPVAVAA